MTWQDLVVALVVVPCLLAAVLFTGCLAFYIVREFARDVRRARRQPGRFYDWAADRDGRAAR